MKQGSLSTGYSVAFYRGGNWWDSKIAPLLGLAYIQMLLMPMPIEQALLKLAGLLVSSFCVAGFVHAWNDLFDIEADRRAGKKNLIGGLSTPKRAGLIAGLAAGGVLP